MAVKAVYLLGDLREREAATRWVGDAELGGAILWAHWRRYQRGKRTDRTELEPLLAALASATEPLEFWEAAKQIGYLKFRQATRPVKRIVMEAADADRRAAGLHALWLLGDRRATPLLLRVAADRAASENERMIAVEALGVSAGEPYVQTQLSRYLVDPSPMVRYSALCAAGAAWACGERIGQELRHALQRATLDPTAVYEDGDIARFAAQLLAPYAGADVYPEVILDGVARKAFGEVRERD